MKSSPLHFFEESRRICSRGKEKRVNFVYYTKTHSTIIIQSDHRLTKRRKRPHGEELVDSMREKHRVGSKIHMLYTEHNMCADRM